MTESTHHNQNLQQRKAAIRARLEHSRALIREDLNDLREDLNPLKTIGNLIGSLLQPAPGAQISDSGIVNFGLDAGISLLANRFVPAHSRSIVTLVAPVLVKNLATHVLPKVQAAAENALEWIVEKTSDNPEEETPSGREVETEPDTVAG